jgi:hypothetical protein
LTCKNLNLFVLFFLGFDPFKETQKALAELINDEVSQQQQQQMNGGNGQRRMPPPPGFSHIQNNNNTFSGFGAASPRSCNNPLTFFTHVSVEILF